MSDYHGNYVMYLRKSRVDIEAEQQGEEETLARHERTLLNLVSRLKLNLVDIYREVVSGETIAARPVMQKLLSEVEAGLWAGVLVMEVERLARGDTIDQGIVAQAFKFSGTKIITPSKTYDPDNEFDEEYFEFGLFMSRREYKAINRRLQRGRIASIREGKWVSSHAPYGYRRVKIENGKGYTLEQVPEEAEVIRTIFALFTEGQPGSGGNSTRLSIYGIAQYLNRLKISSPSHGKWTLGTVRDMLCNPVYVGKVRWNWRKASKRRENGQVVISRPRARPDDPDYLLVKGLHKPIISVDTFDAVQEILRANVHARPLDKGDISNPLAGLVICGKCGHKMQKRAYSKNRCEPMLGCPYTDCNNVASYLSLVESRILQALRDWAEAYRLEWGNIPADDSVAALRKRAIESLDAKLEKLSRQRENLHDLLEQGVYDTDTFLERSRSIASRIRQAEDSRELLQQEWSEEMKRLANRRNILPKVQRLLDVYDALPTAKAKNELLRSALEKVVYTKEKSGRWGKPDDFKIEIYPKIPKIDPPG